jgi:hypothetical protein
VKSTELEITINEVISFYLGDSNDKRNTMRELILYDPSSAFDKKVKILIVIVNRLYPDKIERNAKLFTRLGEVQAIRHDLAYSVLSLKDQPDMSGAHGMVIKYKNFQLVEQELSGKRIADRINDAQFALQELRSILSDISKGEDELPFKQVN